MTSRTGTWVSATRTTAPGAAAGLLHPGWLFALAVLLTNDHLLKGAGLLPEPLTGKLSDLAGLVVAPVLLTRLLGGSAGARRLAFVATAGVFSAVNLSGGLAAAFDGALGALGLPWRTFVDPTDLVALVVLPFAWRIARPEDPRGSRAPRRALAAVGVLACAASSPAATWFTPAFVVNHTDADVQVRLRYPEATLHCDGISGRVARALDPDVFGPATPILLAPKETLALAQNQIAPTFDEDGVPQQARDQRCEAVLVSVEGASERIVFWDRLTGQRVELSYDEVPEELAEGALVIAGGGEGGVRLEPGAGLELLLPAEQISDDHCAIDRSESFGFSALEEAYVGTLRSLEVGDDGCARLGFDDREAPFFLCVPAEELPFSPGDALTLEPILQDPGRAVVLRRSGARPVSVTVFSEVEAITSSRYTATVVDRDCEGSRLECGTYVVPGALELDDGTRIAGGAAVEVVPPYSQRPVRIRVGRAERYVVGAPACEVGKDRPGARVDLMIIEES